MAQTATNPKIEELRFRLKSDPKSRLFFPLAEELRKAGNCAEAEQVLRTGLNLYPTYLGAWVSLGRVLRDQRNDSAAVEALTKALQLDPGNVVAARLLGDAHLALGDKLEAIKKYKLVQALLPSDDDLRATIEQLDRELHPPQIAEVDELPPVVERSAPFTEAVSAPVPDTLELPETEEAGAEEISAAPEPQPTPQPIPEEEESPFDKTAPPFAEAELAYERELRTERSTGDIEPMGYAHDESPFEEPISGYTADALAVEAPAGFQIADAPLVAEVPTELGEELPTVDSTPAFDAPEARHEYEPGNAAETATMADLYARQGLIDDARRIYENILARDPGNEDVRARLAALSTGNDVKVARLENWLAKMTRKEVERV